MPLLSRISDFSYASHGSRYRKKVPLVSFGFPGGSLFADLSWPRVRDLSRNPSLLSFFVNENGNYKPILFYISGTFPPVIGVYLVRQNIPCASCLKVFPGLVRLLSCEGNNLSTRRFNNPGMIFPTRAVLLGIKLQTIRASKTILHPRRQTRTTHQSPLEALGRSLLVYPRSDRSGTLMPAAVCDLPTPSTMPSTVISFSSGLQHEIQQLVNTPFRSTQQPSAPTAILR